MILCVSIYTHVAGKAWTNCLYIWFGLRQAKHYKILVRYELEGVRQKIHRMPHSLGLWRVVCTRRARWRSHSLQREVIFLISAHLSREKQLITVISRCGVCFQPCLQPLRPRWHTVRAQRRRSQPPSPLPLPPARSASWLQHHGQSPPESSCIQICLMRLSSTSLPLTCSSSRRGRPLRLLSAISIIKSTPNQSWKEGGRGSIQAPSCNVM